MGAGGDGRQRGGDRRRHQRAPEDSTAISCTVDVRIVGREDAYGSLIANGGDGDDTIIGAPNARVRGQLITFGDAGNDLLSTPVLSGEREFGAELHGGPGDDTTPYSAPTAFAISW